MKSAIKERTGYIGDVCLQIADSIVLTPIEITAAILNTGRNGVEVMNKRMASRLENSMLRTAINDRNAKSELRLSMREAVIKYHQRKEAIMDELENWTDEAREEIEERLLLYPQF